MATPELARELTEEEIKEGIYKIKIQKESLNKYFTDVSALLLNPDWTNWVTLSQLKEADLRTLSLWLKAMIQSLIQMEQFDYYVINTSNWRRLDSNNIWTPMNALVAINSVIEARFADTTSPLKFSEANIFSTYKSIKEIVEWTIE